MAKETAAKETLKQFETRYEPPMKNKNVITMVVDFVLYLFVYLCGIGIVVGGLLFLLLLVYIGLEWALKIIFL